MKKLFIIFISLFLIGTTATAMSEMFSSDSWRYKMTVVVDTPEGIKTGSAVREVTVTQQPEISPHVTAHTNIKGEAVVVDLGERGVLFALLDSEDYRFFSEAFSQSPQMTEKGLKRVTPPVLTPEGVKYFSNLKNVKAFLNLKKFRGYPRLVTFTDLNDPKTVKEVHVWSPIDPKRPYGKYHLAEDHFAEYFGEGVHLKEITIETTDEPVTWGIEKWLPWLPNRKNVKGYIGGESSPPFKDPTKTYLNGVNFSRGKFWLQE